MSVGRFCCLLADFVGRRGIADLKSDARLIDHERERVCQGKTGVTADRDKIEFRLFNSSSILNITLR